MVREALCNVRKHARAENAIVFGTLDDGWLLLSVKDDGVGFDPAVAAEEGAADGLHFGIGNLRRTAESVGGSLEIESAPGEGTTVRFRIRYGREERTPWML